MKFTATSAFSFLAAVLTVQRTTAECTGTDACVELHRGADCSVDETLVSFIPSCGGGCYQYSNFDSVEVGGTFLFGTDCHVYSDFNCQDEILDTGNILTEKCVNTPGAQSLRCFFAC
ncbi:hypothetical protein B0H16DRAFT_695394 [Mycena metata]|uniref:Uncharacterized protein n=1 Tax=Mycena metata TaxID=1033252 RepID=A0AAD7J3W5_9AGAR|nr:hypothetical protein B0H16DRAFT_695394 [Mycena metata]